MPHYFANILIAPLVIFQTMVQMVKANGVRWYGRVLRKDNGHVFRKVLEFEVKGKRKQGQPKKSF